MAPSGESLGSYLELNETSVNIDFINNIFAIWLQGEWSYSPPIQEVPPLDLIGEYTGRDNVVRYKDGIVTICDITENTEDI